MVQFIGLPDYSLHKKELRYCTEIYLVTTPNGRQYIGQAQCFSGKTRSRRHGARARWNYHCSKKSTCRLLKHSINKYKHRLSEFTVEVILICKSHANDHEIRLIKEYNTYHDDNPLGLNIEMGGGAGINVSPTALANRSVAIKKSWETRVKRNPDEEVKERIRVTNLLNAFAERKLPAFIKKVPWEDTSGYQVVSHPLLKDTKFSTKNVNDIDKHLHRAIAFLESPPESKFRPEPTVRYMKHLRELGVDEKLIDRYQSATGYTFL